MTQTPTWPRRVLQAAAIYNLLWGTWVILMPNHWFDLTGIPRPNYPGIWQCVGMIVGVYGLGYWWASRDFARHWPVIAVGFLGKIFGPIGFLQSVITGALPLSWGWMILTNDLIWWIPFGAMLYLGFKLNSDPLRKFGKTEQGDWTVDQANRLAKSATGESISDLSSKKDLLLVFLRHAGCTFCRETLDELKKSRQEWQRQGLLPVVVHMGSAEQGIEMMKRYDLSDCPVISDPECRVFRAYELPRGTWKQLFGLRVWIEGFKAAILKGYGFGKLVGDGFQMSGAFVVRKGQIVRAYPSKDAADSCSWKPALTAVFLLGLITLASGSFPAVAQTAEPKPNSTSKVTNVPSDYSVSDIRGGDEIEWSKSQSDQDSLVIDIRSQKGIGGFKLTRTVKTWSPKTRIRLHTKGLEQIQLILIGKSTIYSGEFSSTRLKESWVEIQQEVTPQGGAKQTTKPYEVRMPILRVLDAEGKQIANPRVPLEGKEYFECVIPEAWLAESNPESIEIRWVDFFR